MKSRSSALHVHQRLVQASGLAKQMDCLIREKWSQCLPHARSFCSAAMMRGLTAVGRLAEDAADEGVMLEPEAQLIGRHDTRGSHREYAQCCARQTPWHALGMIPSLPSRIRAVVLPPVVNGLSCSVPYLWLRLTSHSPGGKACCCCTMFLFRCA